MHGNISVLVAHGDTGAKEVWQESAKDGGVIPVTGFPRVDDMANEGRATTSLGHGANIRFISYNTCIRSWAVVISGLYLRSVHFGRNEFVVEVVVHGL